MGSCRQSVSWIGGVKIVEVVVGSIASLGLSKALESTLRANGALRNTNAVELQRVQSEEAAAVEEATAKEALQEMTMDEVASILVSAGISTAAVDAVSHLGRENQNQPSEACRLAVGTVQKHQQEGDVAAIKKFQQAFEELGELAVEFEEAARAAKEEELLNPYRPVDLRGREAKVPKDGRQEEGSLEMLQERRRRRVGNISRRMEGLKKLLRGPYSTVAPASLYAKARRMRTREGVLMAAIAEEEAARAAKETCVPPAGPPAQAPGRLGQAGI
jgi:hypothetical protein